MYRLRKNTIQSKLFFNYSCIIIVIIIVFTLSFYIYTSLILKKQASESIYQLSSYISSQFDNEIRDMDMMSIKIIYSNTIKDSFSRFISNPDEVTSLNSQRQINNVIYSIMGPWLSISQINIFSLNGRFMSTGNYSTATTIPVAQLNDVFWIKDTIKKKGHMFVTAPHMDDWKNINKNVISLCRTFSESIGGSILGIVEIQQDYNIFYNIVKNTLAKPDSHYNLDKEVFIFDNNGKLIYPLKTYTGNDINFIWKNIKDNIGKTNTFLMDNTEKTRKIIAYTRSSYTGWTFALIQTEKSLLKPIASFRNAVLLAGIGILLLTMLISYLIARKLTDPIKRIHQSIKNLRIEKLPPVTSSINSGFNELEELNHAFKEMCTRMEISLEDAVKSRSQEIQSRMLALQSQMNPHFLYNTLSIISITAEKGRQNDVVKMCEELSDMLRYVVSDTPCQVTISDELEHTQNYLYLMENRYPGHFNCEIDMPEDMKNIKVPKLIIQPVIENCFKYAINIFPPWKISVKGVITESLWRITVKDNGPGFDDAVLMSIKERLTLQQKDSMKIQENLEGLGLVNIFTRLSLLYGEGAIFELVNNTGGGASVILGGFIQKEESGNSVS